MNAAALPTRDELMAMSEQDLAALAWRATWERKRKRHQIVPDEDSRQWNGKHILMLKAGRGAGKTRTAAEDTGWFAYKNPGSRQLVCAPTSEDVLNVCFMGESGLLACIPRELIKSFTQKPPIITMHNGAMIHGIPASEPDRLRGPQWHRAWLEELSSWQYDRESFDMVVFSLRLGIAPKMIVTTTPKPRALIRELIKRSDVIVISASTYDNIENLAPTFRDALLKYEGTALGRQEIHAELLDPEEQGIIRRSSIRLWPADKPLPWFDYIVMSLDTAFTEAARDKETGDPDPTACQVWGLFQHERRANAMLLDAWEARMGFPELVKRVKAEMQAEYGQMEEPLLKPLIGPAMVNLAVKKIDLLLIEDKGSGISLRQQLASQGSMGYAYNPGRADKLTRLHAVSHLFAGGVVWMVESNNHAGQPRSWATSVVEQLCTYSGRDSIPHDDHIDACTQALRVLSDRNMLDTIKPPLTQRDNVVSMKAAPQNPYAA